MAPVIHSLGVHGLQLAYATEQLRPTQVIEAVLARIAARGDDAVWISRWPDHELRHRAADLDGVGRDRGIAAMPLFGVPCAVKDNIDVAGLATTAGCPAFRYWPDRNAGCVQRLVDAGAIVVGKTNLDQFATGLTGTRSPYGIAQSVFGGGLIAGGSRPGGGDRAGRSDRRRTPSQCHVDRSRLFRTSAAVRRNPADRPVGGRS